MSKFLIVIVLLSVGLIGWLIVESNSNDMTPSQNVPNTNSEAASESANLNAELELE